MATPIATVSRFWQQRDRKQKVLVLCGGVSVCLVLRYAYCRMVRKYRRYPNGPIGLPVIGSILSLGIISNYATYLAHRYGSISMIYLGSFPVVYLSSVDAINAVFKNKASLSRNPNILSDGGVKVHEYGLIVVPYEHWKQKRKDFQTLLTVRLNTTFVNDAHNASCTDYVFHHIEQCIEAGKLWHFHDDVSFITFNLIWFACFGAKTKYHSERRKAVQAFVEGSVRDYTIDAVLSSLNIKLFLPHFIRKRLFWTYGNFLQYLERAVYEDLQYDQDIWNYSNPKWEKHFQQVRDNKEGGIISLFLAHHRFSEKSLSDIHGTKGAILTQLANFLIAGTDTTKNTMEFGLVLLAKHEHVQDCIYKELTAVYERDDVEMTKHRWQDVIREMHYLRAFMMEVLRISSVVQIGLPHYMMEEMQIDGFVIPKNAVVIASLSYAGTQDSYWMDRAKLNKDGSKANVLDIDLWLDENKKFKKGLHKDKMLAFGTGPRNCAGKDLALRSIHLLFAKLIMKYRLSVPEEYKDAEIVQKEYQVLVMDPKIPLKMQKR